MLFHFLLLYSIPDHDDAGRKTWFTCGVLGMEVGRGEEELRVVRCKLCGHSRHRSAIFRA